MTYQTKTTEEIFEEWGFASRLLPSDNEALKDNAISKLVLSSPRKTPRHILFSRPWPSVVFAILAVIALFSDSFRFISQTIPLSPNGSSVDIGRSGGAVPLAENLAEKGTKTIPGFYPSPEIPIVDSREFMKISYNASINTRRVEEITQHIQTTVRGFGGRVDGATSSSRWGYVSFAVPADRFESFKAEIKSLVGKRFFVEETSAQNLLPQKRSIEQYRSEIEKNLAEIRASRDQLIKNHTGVVASINSQLGNVGKQLDDLQTELLLHPERNAEIAARRQEFLTTKENLEANLAAENREYGKKLSLLDEKIKSERQNLGEADRENRELLENVATVQGFISVRWISLWGVAGAYLPKYWVSWLLVIVAALWYFIYRRKTRFVLPQE